MPPFYVEMLKVWQDIENCRHFENEKINPIIFNNRHVCLRNRMIFDQDLLQRNVSKVSDIILDGNLRSATHFVGLGIHGEGLLKIHDIFGALPLQWKDGKALSDYIQVDIQTFEIRLKVSGHIGMLIDLKSRHMYEYLIKRFQNENDLGIGDGHIHFDYSNDELKNIFLRIKSAVVGGKLREFQYKLVHRALYTKEHLFKFGFVNDNLCSFCKNEIETYSHLFWECLYVQRLWLDMIEQLDLIEIRNVDWKIIFVGLAGRSYRVMYCNAIIFLLKYNIYSFRTKGILPSVRKVYKIILDYEEEEKKIAVNKGKLGVHLQKWEHHKR